MNGQWIGRYSGSNSGRIVADLDDRETHFEGPVTIYDDNQKMPFSWAYIKTPDRNTVFEICLDVFPLDPRTGDPAPSWEQITALFPPNISFPKKATASFSVDEDGRTLKVQWKTDIGTFGAASLPRSRAGEPSELVPRADVSCWGSFKSYLSTLPHRRHIFRGQRDGRRLRTGFHRTGRADLRRFLATDIQTLHRHLTQWTSHIFNLGIPDQNGAFFNLAQHHGYPTPLLDWTYSPYVGAFFAYRGIRESDAQKAEPDTTVRIFIFDQMRWREDYQQLSKITGAPPHFSIMEFIAIDNARLIPQQSISSLTNIDDIEEYIQTMESERKRYLEVVDLPISERSLVIRELSAMGVTAGSLFPGLDGACEELKERFFRL